MCHYSFVKIHPRPIHWQLNTFMAEPEEIQIWQTAPPAMLLPKIKDKVNQGASVSILIDDFAKGIQTLFGQYFLGFAITCLAIAAALYVARHGHKHVGHIKAVPDAPKLATPDKKVVATKK